VEDHTKRFIPFAASLFEAIDHPLEKTDMFFFAWGHKTRGLPHVNGFSQLCIEVSAININLFKFPPIITGN